MHSWQELRAEMLRQEILELEAQPIPRDRLAFIKHQQRILTLRRDLASLGAEEAEEIIKTFKELMYKLSDSPKDVSEEEVLKVTGEVERKVNVVEGFREKRSLKKRADMQQAWQRASLLQRGNIAILYSLHRLGRGLGGLPFRSVRFFLRMIRSTARKRG